jgi:hypothetical protein
VDVNTNLKFAIAIDQLARLAEQAKKEAIHDAATGNKEKADLGRVTEKAYGDAITHLTAAG